MKIKVESDKIVKAVKKSHGIELVLENPEDAKEALNLLLQDKGLWKKDETQGLSDVNVTSLQKYETSAVDYKMIFRLEFLFEDDVPQEKRVSCLKEFQGFFTKF